MCITKQHHRDSWYEFSLHFIDCENQEQLHIHSVRPWQHEERFLPHSEANHPLCLGTKSWALWGRASWRMRRTGSVPEDHSADRWHSDHRAEPEGSCSNPPSGTAGRLQEATQDPDLWIHSPILKMKGKNKKHIKTNVTRNTPATAFISHSKHRIKSQLQPSDFTHFMTA